MKITYTNRKNNEPWTYSRWMWTDFDCYFVYANTVSEAEKLVSTQFTEIDRRIFTELVSKPSFIAEAEKQHNISILDEGVSKLINTPAIIKEGSGVIFYFEAAINECEGYASEIMTETFKTSGKFKTIYEACTTDEMKYNRLPAISSTSKVETMKLAKAAAEKNDCTYTIRKRMVLEENGNDSLTLASVSPQRTAIYSKRKLFCFFGVNQEKYEKNKRQHEKWAQR